MTKVLITSGSAGGPFTTATFFFFFFVWRPLRVKERESTSFRLRHTLAFCAIPLRALPLNKDGLGAEGGNVHLGTRLCSPANPPFHRRPAESGGRLNICFLAQRERGQVKKEGFLLGIVIWARKRRRAFYGGVFVSFSSAR